MRVSQLDTEGSSHTSQLHLTLIPQLTLTHTCLLVFSEREHSDQYTGTYKHNRGTTRSHERNTHKDGRTNKRTLERTKRKTHKKHKARTHMHTLKQPRRSAHSSPPLPATYAAPAARPPSSAWNARKSSRRVPSSQCPTTCRCRCIPLARRTARSTPMSGTRLNRSRACSLTAATPMSRRYICSQTP